MSKHRMPKYATRTDANQGEIMSALERAGAKVQPLNRIGFGVPDLLIGFRGTNWLLEIKDGAKSPSKRQLTQHEREWHASWPGQVAVVESVEQALEVIGAL